MRRRAARRLLRRGGVVLVVLGTACDGEAPATEDAVGGGATPVRTMQVTVTSEARSVRTSGTVASRAEMDLAFKIPGYVGEILVEEGEEVRAGQVLARLRTDEVDAGVRSAEAQAELASTTLDRVETLFRDSVVAESRLDEARDAFERAQAALDIARFNQEYATIRAPAVGRVLRRMIEESEFTGAGVPVFRLSAAPSGWIVRTAVADRQVVRLSPGDPAEVTLPAFDDLVLQGRVTEIAEAADPRTGTFEVEITLDEPARRLRSGMVARVLIRPSVSDELSMLPITALVDTDGRDAAVFVVEGERVHRRPVRVVRIGSGSVGIRAPGLEGATVVTDGAAYLRDGDLIDDRTGDVRETPPQPGGQRQ